jgi:hypothetical protein
LLQQQIEAFIWLFYKLEKELYRLLKYWRKSKMNKVYKVMASTAIAGMLLGGAVFEPATLFAAGKKQTTTVNKATSKNDAKKVSMTQNGITLTATKATYDGNYVQFEIKRSGGGLKSGILDQQWDGTT